MKDTNKLVIALIIITLIIGLIIISPMFTIAALNTLFGLSIAMNFWTWLSMAWLHILIAGSVLKLKRKS